VGEADSGLFCAGLARFYCREGKLLVIEVRSTNLNWYKRD